MPGKPGDDRSPRGGRPGDGRGPRRPSDGRGRPGNEDRRPRRDGDSRGRPGDDDRRSNRAEARDRAEKERQPYRPPRKPGPRRPSLPEERPIIPRDAWRDLRATVPPNVLDEVVKAVGTATDALEEGNTARATELLTWAKSVATRSATIREALGVALYTAGKYAEAHSELLAYRRLSASHDQNHLLADCARAAGRHDRVREYVEQMMAAKVEPSRVAEGLIVLAGDRADTGDLEGALETLRQADLDPDKVEPWHPRLWYVAGDLSERLGLLEQARDYFEAILSFDDQFADVDERLAALE